MAATLAVPGTIVAWPPPASGKLRTPLPSARYTFPSRTATPFGASAVAKPTGAGLSGAPAGSSIRMTAAVRLVV